MQKAGLNNARLVLWWYSRLGSRYVFSFPFIYLVTNNTFVWNVSFQPRQQALHYHYDIGNGERPPWHVTATKQHDKRRGDLADRGSRRRYVLFTSKFFFSFHFHFANNLTSPPLPLWWRRRRMPTMACHNNTTAWQTGWPGGQEAWDADVSRDPAMFFSHISFFFLFIFLLLITI